MTPPSLTRILYVEDDPGIQAIVRIALERRGGFTVKVCDSGKQAIEVAPEFAPDLILLDVMMPGMDGIGTFKALREIPETVDIPVIFVTAKVQQREVDLYKELGIAAVIPKPFDPLTLSDTVRDIWGGLPMPTDDLSDEITRLGREFSLRSMAGLEVVERARQQLGEPYEQHKMNTALSDIHAVAHRLAGGGATFGYPEVSATAAPLEIFVDAIMKGETMMSEAAVERLDELITALRRACSSAVCAADNFA